VRCIRLLLDYSDLPYGAALRGTWYIKPSLDIPLRAKLRRTRICSFDTTTTSRYESTPTTYGHTPDIITPGAPHTYQSLLSRIDSAAGRSGPSRYLARSVHSCPAQAPRYREGTAPYCTRYLAYTVQDNLGGGVMVRRRRDAPPWPAVWSHFSRLGMATINDSGQTQGGARAGRGRFVWGLVLFFRDFVCCYAARL
jgi:hypothetical protein